MRAVVQRVKRAELTVNGEPVSQIGNGLVVFFGVKTGDTTAQAEYLAGKIARLRIFEDENSKMNRCIKEENGEVLFVSQFTLYGDASHGNRPSFTQAAGRRGRAFIRIRRRKTAFLGRARAYGRIRRGYENSAGKRRSGNDLVGNLKILKRA